MKTPKITPEAVEAACREPVRPGTTYEWLATEQPALVNWANLTKPPSDILGEDTATLLVGVAFTLLCLNHMPEKTPANDAQTLQDRLNRILRICNQVNDPGEDRDAFGAIQEIGDIASQQ